MAYNYRDKTANQLKNLIKRANKKIANYKYRYKYDYSDILLSSKFKNIDNTLRSRMEDFDSRADFLKVKNELEAFLERDSILVKTYVNPETNITYRVTKQEYDKSKKLAQEMNVIKEKRAERLKKMVHTADGVTQPMAEYANMFPEDEVNRVINPEPIDVNTMEPRQLRAFTSNYGEGVERKHKRTDQQLRDNFMYHVDTVLENHGYDVEKEIITELIEDMNINKFMDWFYTVDIFDISAWSYEKYEGKVAPMEQQDGTGNGIFKDRFSDTNVSTKVSQMLTHLRDVNPKKYNEVIKQHGYEDG